MNEWVIGAVEVVRGLGWVGPLAFFFLYVAWTVALLPGTPITLVGGFLYGPVWGLALVSPASVTGATVAFLLSRTVLRDRVDRRLRDRPALSEMNAAAERSGLKLIVLLRLSPIVPFNVLNYSLGLTRVRLRDYILASFAGMLPGTAAIVYVGSLAYSIAEVVSGTRESTRAENAIYWLGLGATVLAAVILTRMARRALRAAKVEQA